MRYLGGISVGAGSRRSPRVAIDCDRCRQRGETGGRAKFSEPAPASVAASVGEG